MIEALLLPEESVEAVFDKGTDEEANFLAITSRRVIIGRHENHRDIEPRYGATWNIIRSIPYQTVLGIRQLIRKDIDTKKKEERVTFVVAFFVHGEDHSEGANKFGRQHLFYFPDIDQSRQAHDLILGHLV